MTLTAARKLIALSKVVDAQHGPCYLLPDGNQVFINSRGEWDIMDMREYLNEPTPEQAILYYYNIYLKEGRYEGKVKKIKR